MDVKMTPLERLRHLISPTKDRKKQSHEGEFEEKLANENGEDPPPPNDDSGKESGANRHRLFENPAEARRAEQKTPRSQTVDGKGLKVNVLA